MSAKELVYDAVLRRSTDIHLEPTTEQLSVRYRIDGILHAAEPFDRPTGDAVINVFKVLAALDISEKRKPQDGSFGAKLEGRELEFRVATSGSKAGEKMVMRILDNAAGVSKLDDAGHAAEARRRDPRHRHPAPRHVPLLRADRLRQDDHALRLPPRDRPVPEEHHHGRRPDRIPPRQHHADGDQHQERPDLRRQPAVDHAARPRRHHDRRNPRPGNRRRSPARPRRPATWSSRPSTPTTPSPRCSGCSTSASSRS